jgi:hypothetical protein
MNGETLKRLIRATADGSHEDLSRLARKIIQMKREAGQTRLSDELEAILNQPAKPRPEPESARGFRELPVSRRQREQLATSGLKVTSQLGWWNMSEGFVGLSTAQVVKIAQHSAKSVVLANQKTVEEQNLCDARYALAERIECSCSLPGQLEPNSITNRRAVP